MKRRYVVSKFAPKRQPLPKDKWQGRRFREADGTLCEVVASGRMPSLDWPNGSGCSLNPVNMRTIGDPVVKP